MYKKQVTSNLKFFMFAFPIMISLISSLLPISHYSDTKFTPCDDGFESSVHDLNQGFVEQPDQGRNIFYWIQVSDIHISMSEEGQENRENFKSFCSTTIPTIKPAFVLSSGDNVNGIFRDDSRPEQQFQSEAEYQFFRQTLEENELGDSFYYTGIGNHETYNQGLNRSLFSKYIRNTPMYYFDVASPCGTYRFVSMDTTQNIGLGNPFDYWGEMKTNKLNQLESLLEETPEDIDEFVFWGHHPINFIYSERSNSGKNLEKLLMESDSSIYLCGHVHTENTYWNHGSFSELECPAFKEGSNFRILAIDNGFYSFSEQISENWPVILITNPISDLLYTDDADFTKMDDINEIRVLIFDPNPIQEAFVELNGQRIGDLTNQGDHLWTLSSDPSEIAKGRNDLKVIIRSKSGQNSEEITFNSENFVPVQTDGFLKYIISLDLQLAFTILLALMFLGFYSISLLPKIYYFSNEKRRKFLSEINQEDQNGMNFLKRYLFKNWIEVVATLPLSSWLPLIISPLLLFILPIFIAPMINYTWGSLWLYGIFISGNHALEFYSLIFALIYIILFGMVQHFVIRSNQPKPSKMRYMPIIFYYLILVVIAWFFSRYFSFVAIVISPFVLILFLVPIYLVWQSFKN